MKTNLESITWKGGRGRFENLAKSSQLKRGHIYFVGDYVGSELGGLEQSKSGVIYVATSERSYVTFGTFDLKNLEKRITEIEQRLEELGGNVEKLIKEVVTLDEEVVTLGGKVSEIGSKVSTIEEGAEKNKINVVERNGQAITPSEDKVINILVPVNTSELNNDSKYQTDADIAETIIGVNLNVASGIITLTRKNGTTFTIDLPTEKIIKSGYYDSASEEIVLVLADDSEIRFNASQLIDEYYADDVTLEQYTDTADGNKKKFRLKTAYKNKIDGAEQTSNKTASVTSSSTATQYPSAKAVWEAIKDFATSVQTFTQATTRANIESGETISTIFGKIRKWFADLKTVAFSGSYNDLSDKPSIGNGKVTIKQKGVEKGSFSLNQSGDATVELTDENTTYGIATSSTAGIVKSGGDITVASDGTMSQKNKSGLSNQNLYTLLANTATDSGYTMLDPNYNTSGWAMLKSVRSQANTPNWFQPDYSAGIAFGGADTKGCISMRYQSASIRFAGGNGSTFRWWMTITGNHNASYNLANFATKSQLTDGSVTKVGTATKGSTTKPIYLNSGVPTECDAYAGGTAVTLNKSSKSGSTASFYAPTTVNDNQTNHCLFSNGPDAAPEFRDILQYATTSNGIPFNKFYRSVSFHQKNMYQSGSAECDWRYSSGVVFSGATIKFTQNLASAPESGVMPLWLEKGAIVKVDEWVSSWGTYETRTYIAQRSGLLFVGCWGDPKVYTLSSLDLFDKGITIISTTDSRMIKQSDDSYIIDLISDNILYDTIVIQNNSNTTTNYDIRLIKMNDIPNGHKIRVLCVNAWAHFIRSGTNYGFSNLSYTSSRQLNTNCFAEFLYFNNMWYSDQY